MSTPAARSSCCSAPTSAKVSAFSPPRPAPLPRARSRTRAAAAASTSGRSRSDRRRAALQPGEPGVAPGWSGTSASACPNARRRRLVPAAPLQLAEQRSDVRAVLGRGSAGVDGQPHRLHGAVEVAVELAQVGGAGVAGRGSACGRSSPAARRRPRRSGRARPARRRGSPRPRVPACSPRASAPAEVVAGERELARRREAWGVRGVPRTPRPSRSSPVGGLARLLQVRLREVGRGSSPRPPRTARCSAGMSADVPVSTGGRGATGAARRQRSSAVDREPRGEDEREKERGGERRESAGIRTHFIRPAAAGPGRGRARCARTWRRSRCPGSATYGNVARNGLSFWSMPSPSGSCLPPCSGFSSAPPMTRSSMSVTSSASRRPFGKPAWSPASRPKRFGVARRRDAEVELQRVGRHRRSARSASGPGCRSAAPGRCPCGCSP